MTIWQTADRMFLHGFLGKLIPVHAKPLRQNAPEILLRRPVHRTIIIGEIKVRDPAVKCGVAHGLDDRDRGPFPEDGHAVHHQPEKIFPV